MEWQLFADLAETAGDRRVAVSVGPDATVEDALDALLADRPALRERVRDDDGDLHEHVSVLRNGANVRETDGMAQAVEDGDELALLPPVSGG